MAYDILFTQAVNAKIVDWLITIDDEKLISKAKQITELQGEFWLEDRVPGSNIFTFLIAYKNKPLAEWFGINNAKSGKRAVERLLRDFSMNTLSKAVMEDFIYQQAIKEQDEIILL